MFRKDLSMPYHLRQYQEYFRRLRPGPAKDKLKEQIRRGWAGYRGEKSVRYQLELLSGPDELIFHNLRLFDGVHMFQIDWLILFPGFMLILECKNMAGTITFGHSIRQMVRELKEQKDAFDDPLIQSETHGRRLHRWLKKEFKSLPVYPLETLAVFVSPGEMRTDGLNPRHVQKIIRCAELESKIIRLKRKYQQKVMSASNLDELSDRLLTCHCERKMDLIESGKIIEDDLIKGIQCPRCETFAMKWYRRSWRCPFCHFSSQDAHVPVLLSEYRLIKGEKITNHQCCDFLQLESSDSAKYILQSLNLRSVGRNKGKVYLLPDLE